jgi:sugar (pentulose or hexulose) kinase
VSADHLLAIDVGTQSVRALLFDAAGALLAKAKVPIEPYVAAHPGWAENDPELYWSAAGDACRALLANPSARREAIAGLALTTQRGTVVVTDAAGRPLRPAIVWLDQRRTTGLPRIGGVEGIAFRALGVAETVATFQAEAEANWLIAHEPATWAQTARYLLLSGFLVHRLVGRFVDADAAQVGYLPFDFRRRRWAKRGDWKWKAVPLEPDMLPELVPTGERLGELVPAAAEHLGLPAGLPVIAAGADKACEVLGAGCLAPHVAALSFGTTATINTTHRRYVEPIPLVPPYPAAVPGAYSLEIQVHRGFWLVEWFRREFGAAEEAAARARGLDPVDVLDELLGTTPPGAMGLLLQPTFSPGIRIPGPEAKGAAVGFGDVHTRAHLYRAVVEGLAFALREGGDRTERRTKVPITALRVAGGGSRSDRVVQIAADVFGLPVGRPHVYETSGLGAAIDAAVGLGIHPSFDAAVAAMTRLVETRDPEPGAAGLYDELYRRVYRRMYERLRPLYEEIQAITGYPPPV